MEIQVGDYVRLCGDSNILKVGKIHNGIATLYSPWYKATFRTEPERLVKATETEVDAFLEKVKSARVK